MKLSVLINIVNLFTLMDMFQSQMLDVWEGMSVTRRRRKRVAAHFLIQMISIGMIFLRIPASIIRSFNL
jgi:hypothetical protein